MSSNSMRPGDFQRYIARVSGGPRDPGGGHRGEAAKVALRRSFDKYAQEQQERQWRLTRTREQDRLELEQIWEQAGAEISSPVENNQEGDV